MSVAEHRAQEATARFVPWLDPFLKRFRRAPAPAASGRWVPDGMRVYCIGDIHGRDDLLRQMAECVEADIEPSSCDQAVTVFLGDYVDRGLGSMRVVEQLARGDWPTPMIALAGNHEDLLMAFLEDGGVLEAWRDLGGLETLHSYGVNLGPGMAKRDFGAVQAAFAASFAEDHRQFIEGLKISTVIGDYFFCHAGVRPGVPLDRQNRNDLLTIRDPFLSSKAEHGKLVVHGHTPSLVPEICPNRIGIDTAGYATGRLACLVLEKDQRCFLYVGDGERDMDRRGGNGLP